MAKSLNWADGIVEWTVESATVTEEGDLVLILRRDAPGLGQVWNTVTISYSEQLGIQISSD